MDETDTHDEWRRENPARSSWLDEALGIIQATPLVIRTKRPRQEAGLGGGGMTKIPWTDATWNPWIGCDKIAPEWPRRARKSDAGRWRLLRGDLCVTRYSGAT